MKEKTVKLSSKHRAAATAYTYLSQTHFSLCSLKKKKKYSRRVLSQVCPWTTCRETLTTHIKGRLLNSPAGSDCVEKGKVGLLIMLKKTDSTVKTKKLIDGNLSRGLRMVNFFEKKVNWPLSKIFRVRDVNIPAGFYIYVALGPKQWIRSPYMLSLYALLFRVGKFKDLGRFKTFRGFIGACNRLVGEAASLRVSSSYTRNKFNSWPDAGTIDLRYLHHTADKILAVLESQDRLFKKRSCKDLYRIASTLDGITLLCRASIADMKVKKNFVELCEEVDLNYRKKDPW